MPRKRMFRAAALAALVSITASGCMALPMLAGRLQDAEATNIALEGNGDAMAAFRGAVNQAGGVITLATRDYARGEFRDSNTSVEIQVRAGEGRQKLLMTGASGRASFMPWVGGDSIGKTTARVAGIMQGAGFQIAAQNPEQAR